MGWARLDDGYATHPKLIAAGIEATGLDARAIAHCAKHETDGFIAEDEAAMLSIGARKPADLPARLVANRRWHRFNGSGPCSDCRCLTEHGIDWSDDRRKGYVIHDYLVYNDTHAKLEAKRKAERIRKASGRIPSGQPPGSGEDSAGTPEGSDKDSGSRPPLARSAPARPVPSRPLANSPPPQNQGVVDDAAEEDDEDLTNQPTQSTPTDVARLVAERRYAKQRPGTIHKPSGWKKTVADGVLAEWFDEIETMLANGKDAGTIAAELEPDPHEADQVVRRECCGTSIQTGHRASCSEVIQPVWDVDDNGMAVRVEAR